MSEETTLLWFRSDLRLTDHPALQAAIDNNDTVLPVYIHAPEEEAPWSLGGASQWWLHQSLTSLQTSLRKLGSRMIVRRGPTLDSLRSLVKETGAKRVLWNRRYEPHIIARDSIIKESLRSEGIEAESFNSGLLHEPWTICNQSRKPFQVFTPFWKTCLAKTEPGTTLGAPSQLQSPKDWPQGLTIDALALEPKLPWASGFQSAWKPGEAGAALALTRFLEQSFEAYAEQRNRPDRVGTSRLSPHLHFGEISPRQIWHAIQKIAVRRKLPDAQWRSSQFVTELGWREFAHHLLFHFPNTPTEPLRENFRNFPWHTNEPWLRAWQKGQTGYPIVDAGMRELWATGWMHNRVRMIVASFLVKDLLISWTEGARWFWDTLVDADLAQNTLGWQWTAGCGADAAPYFRVFNPVSQGEKFDPKGDYVRLWCPELTRVPEKWIHQPWSASAAILTECGVKLGTNYPERIVSHHTAREVALEAFARTRGR